MKNRTYKIPVNLVMYNEVAPSTIDVIFYNYNNLNPTRYNHNCEQ